MSTADTGGTKAASGALSNRFTIESHILSTRSADAFKAVDRQKGIGVCLWMLRHPLAQRSNAVNRFSSRLQKIKDLGPQISPVENFGVDSGGMAYAELPSLDGNSIIGGKIDPAEAERRFILCLRLIERLHASDIICGDLCASSFWINRDGDVQFIGVMGSFDAEAAATAMLPPMETLNFIPPEQRSGGGLEPASDVFALGVLGYLLFTGAYPYPSGTAMFTAEMSPDQIKPLSAYIAAAPAWAQEILMRCLQPKPTARYSNAGEVYKALLDARERSAAGQESPVRIQRDAVVVKDSQNANNPVRSTQYKMQTVSSEEKPRPASGEQSPPPIRWKLIAFVAIIVGMVIAGIMYFSQQKAEQEERRTHELTQLQQAAGDGKIRTAIGVLGEREASDAEREAQLEKLVSSNDPLAHDALVKAAKSAATDDERMQAEKAVIDRARRLGLVRASEQVRQWLRTVKSTELPQCYESTLRSLDTTLPIDARNQALKQVYASNPKLALRLAAALALDTNKIEDYQPVLSQLLTDYQHNEELAGHSLLALLLTDPELTLIYGDDVIQKKDQIPDSDIIWILKVLADRGDQNVRAIANLAMDRNLLSPVRKVFLTLVRDRGDIPPEVLSALIRNAAGVFKSSDVAIFGSWYDMQSEKVLLAIMAESEDKDVLTDAFDTVAGKSMSIEPSASFVEWVREHHWNDRADFAHAIGLIAESDLLSPDELNKALESFDKYASERGLMEIFLKSNSAPLVRAAVDRYKDKLGIGSLISLLGSPDKQVRIVAIRSLKDVNEVAILKFIIDKYEHEQDPEVQRVYQDSFWVIREREQKK